MKPKNFIIPLHIYPFDVMVSVGETDEQLFKNLRRHGIKSKKDLGLCRYEPVGVGRSVRFRGNQILIRLKNRPRTPEQRGVLAHEVFHAVTYIMDAVGVKLKLQVSDEPYAYLTGYLTEKIYERL